MSAALYLVTPTGRVHIVNRQMQGNMTTACGLARHVRDQHPPFTVISGEVVAGRICKTCEKWADR